MFVTDEHRIVSGKAFHMVIWGKPIDLCQQKIQHKRKRAYERPFPTQSMLIGRKNQAKFENDCVTRNGHRIKITQPNSMIFISFSSAEDVLTTDVKEYDTVSSQGGKICKFRFFWDTRYIQEQKVYLLTTASEIF